MGGKRSAVVDPRRNAFESGAAELQLANRDRLKRNRNAVGAKNGDGSRRGREVGFDAVALGKFRRHQRGVGSGIDEETPRAAAIPFALDDEICAQTLGGQNHQGGIKGRAPGPRRLAPKRRATGEQRAAKTGEGEGDEAASVHFAGLGKARLRLNAPMANTAAARKTLREP